MGRALNQDVPRVQVSMDKVVNKDLEDGKSLRAAHYNQTYPQQNLQANSKGLFLVCSPSLLMYIILDNHSALETSCAEMAWVLH